VPEGAAVFGVDGSCGDGLGVDELRAPLTFHAVVLVLSDGRRVCGRLFRSLEMTFQRVV